MLVVSLILDSSSMDLMNVGDVIKCVWPVFIERKILNRILSIFYIITYVIFSFFLF